MGARGQRPGGAGLGLGGTQKLGVLCAHWLGPSFGCKEQSESLGWTRILVLASFSGACKWGIPGPELTGFPVDF